LIKDIKNNAEAFFDENINILNPSFLLDSEKFQLEFKKKVILNIQNPIDSIIKDISELVYSRSKKQAKTVIHYVNKRPKQMGRI
jgi:hypothetical protein